METISVILFLFEMVTTSKANGKREMDTTRSGQQGNERILLAIEKSTKNLWYTRKARSRRGCADYKNDGMGVSDCSQDPSGVRPSWAGLRTTRRAQRDRSGALISSKVPGSESVCGAAGTGRCARDLAGWVERERMWDPNFPSQTAPQCWMENAPERLET